MRSSLGHREADVVHLRLEYGAEPVRLGPGGVDDRPGVDVEQFGLKQHEVTERELLNQAGRLQAGHAPLEHPAQIRAVRLGVDQVAADLGLRSGLGRRPVTGAVRKAACSAESGVSSEPAAF